MPDGRCGILLLLVLGACRCRLLQLILAAARCFLHARLLQHLRCGDVLLLVLDNARRLPRVLPFAAAHARHSTWPLATTPARHPTWRVAAHARLSVVPCAVYRCCLCPTLNLVACYHSCSMLDVATHCRSASTHSCSALGVSLCFLSLPLSCLTLEVASCFHSCPTFGEATCSRSRSARGIAPCCLSLLLRLDI